VTRVHEHPKKYDAFEQRLASRHEAFVRTAINKLNAILAKSRAVVAAHLDTMRHYVLHTVDLPAGTDVNRLDHQTGRTRPDPPAAIKSGGDIPIEPAPATARSSTRW
jgi:hypothetical protein